MRSGGSLKTPNRGGNSRSCAQMSPSVGNATATRPGSHLRQTTPRGPPPSTSWRSGGVQSPSHPPRGAFGLSPFLCPSVEEIAAHRLTIESGDGGVSPSSTAAGPSSSPQSDSCSSLLRATAAPKAQATSPSSSGGKATGSVRVLLKPHCHRRPAAANFVSVKAPLLLRPR